MQPALLPDRFRELESYAGVMSDLVEPMSDLVERINVAGSCAISRMVEP
jgi:hypothetical protein